MAASPSDITLFYWSFSPWASKITAYLALRSLPHSECDQPITLPRPDIKALGINYRRVPVLTIGRDVYCDSLCIIEALEKLFPSKELNTQNPTAKALEKLLEKWTDVVVFKPAAAAIPSSLDLLKDPAFIKDRTELWGRDWEPAEQDRLRPAGLANLQANFDFLEDLLSDGREWILGEKEGPKLADIHAAWIFVWMRNLPDGLPEKFFGRNQYPGTNGWLDRYERAVAAAQEKAKDATKILSGEDALDKIFGTDEFVNANGEVEENPFGVRKDQLVEIAPIDTGFNYKDVGKLVKLDNREVTIEKVSEKHGKAVRVHFPRWNFSISAVEGKNGQV